MKMTGLNISHYKIIEKLGEGGMGVVYKAEDTKLKRVVALKFLRPLTFGSDDQKERFINEARATAALDHPNICTIYEIDEYDDQLFIAMAYAEGINLKDKLRAGPLTVNDALLIGIAVASGLEAAHKNGIVHRDIKSANIVVSDGCETRITDFGLAKAIDGPEVPRMTVAVGTVAYMSPEQARGEDVDERTDIWSLGVCLYEMLTGRVPFERDYDAAVVYSILNEYPARMSESRTDIPAAFEWIVERTMSKHPDERYQTASELLAELKGLRQELDTGVRMARPNLRQREPSIAVLPFADMSRQKDQEYFCDGIAEEVISTLTRVDGLRVVARTSSFSFKGKAQDVREIARKLGVEAVLEGSVRKVGKKLRITAQLINAADGYHLWSERYDRELEDIFAIQDDITLAIVDSLKVALFGEERVALTKRHTDDLEAYSDYLRGRFFWNKRMEEGYEKSLDYFRSAIEKDPEYARAYAGIADCYDLLGWYGYLSPQEAFPKAREAAEKAREIDGTLAEASASLGWISVNYDWDWEVAEREYLRALESNPNYATAHQWYAEFLSYMGRHAESIAEAERARKLDPLSLIINNDLGQVLCYARQYNRAIDQLQKTLEMDPNFIIAHFFLALAYSQNSMFEEAIAEIRKARKLSRGGDSLILAQLAAIYAFSGRRVEAERLLHELSELAAERYVAPFSLSLIHVGLGELDRAFELLSQAYEERDHWLETLKVHPMLDGIRTDPRYENLLAQMKFGD